MPIDSSYILLLWRFFLHQEYLWCGVLKKKKWSSANRCNYNVVIRSSYSCQRKFISQRLLSSFLKHLRFDVGSGSRIRLMEDVWIENWSCKLDRDASNFYGLLLFISLLFGIFLSEEIWIVWHLMSLFPYFEIVCLLMKDIFWETYMNCGCKCFC